MTDYYAKSEKRAKLLLSRLTGKPFPPSATEAARYYIKVPEENKAFIEKFDNTLVARGLSHGARIHYLRMLETFCSFNCKPFSRVTVDDTMEFVKYVSNDYVSKNFHRKLSIDSVRHHKTALKYFMAKFYEGNKEVDRNDRGIPMCVAWIRREKNDFVRKLPKDMLSTEEIKRMIEVADNPRDRALVAVLYEGALRASELLDMKLKHVELDKYGAKITVSGKTGDRVVRLINSVPDLQAWLNCHPFRDSPEAWLWSSMRKRVRRDNEAKGETSIKYRSEQLKIKGLQYRVTGLAELAGVKKRVYCHLLRHSRLTELAKGMTEQELKVFAGWTPDSKTASTYIHLSAKDISKRLLQINGIIPEEDMVDTTLQPRVCPRCKTKNPSVAKYCSICSMVLDQKEALKVDMEVKIKDNATIEYMKDPEALFKRFQEFLQYQAGKAGETE